MKKFLWMVLLFGLTCPAYAQVSTTVDVDVSCQITYEPYLGKCFAVCDNGYNGEVQCNGYESDPSSVNNPDTDNPCGPHNEWCDSNYPAPVPGTPCGGPGQPKCAGSTKNNPVPTGPQGPIPPNNPNATPKLPPDNAIILCSIPSVSGSLLGYGMNGATQPLYTSYWSERFRNQHPSLTATVDWLQISIGLYNIASAQSGNDDIYDEWFMKNEQEIDAYYRKRFAENKAYYDWLDESEATPEPTGLTIGTGAPASGAKGTFWRDCQSCDVYEYFGDDIFEIGKDPRLSQNTMTPDQFNAYCRRMAAKYSGSK